MLATPAIDDAFRAQQGERAWRVEIKRRDRLSTVTYPFNPLDAVGWHGDLMPVRLNWRDIRPIMSHPLSSAAIGPTPPSWPTASSSLHLRAAAVRDRSGGALKVPFFFHSNDDYDEVLFYHRGDFFFSRDNIDRGMLTFHPSGFPHGPHPKALKNAHVPSKSETDEVAVMVDTRDGLEVAQTARGRGGSGLRQLLEIGRAMKLASLNLGSRRRAVDRVARPDADRLGR